MTGCPGPPWQAGVELSAQVDALHAEKEVLRRSVSEKECELLSTRGLIEEKELQLSQEADKASREIRELQGRLLEKVQCCVESPWGEMFGGCQPMQPVGYHLYQQSWDGKGLSKNAADGDAFPLSYSSCLTEQPGAEPAAEAAGGSVWSPAGDSERSPGHPP